MSPLTAKGKKIKKRMMQPESAGGYGPKKGETIFYKTEAKGKLGGLTKRKKKKH